MNLIKYIRKIKHPNLVSYFKSEYTWKDKGTSEYNITYNKDSKILLLIFLDRKNKCAYVISFSKKTIIFEIISTNCNILNVASMIKLVCPNEDDTVLTYTCEPEHLNIIDSDELFLLSTNYDLLELNDCKIFKECYKIYNAYYELLK